MNGIKIEVDGDKAALYTPYNDEFVSKVKNIGGKWNGSKKVWVIDKEAVDVVREIMLDVYGYNDVTANVTVNLMLTVGEGGLSEDRRSVVLFGKTLSRAYGRDTGGRAGDDVYYLSGGPSSGGSAKNWESTVKAGSRIKLAQVNQQVYERELPNVPDNVTVEILKQGDSKAALRQEKERLLARLDEINRLLEE